MPMVANYQEVGDKKARRISTLRRRTTSKHCDALVIRQKIMAAEEPPCWPAAACGAVAHVASGGRRVALRWRRVFRYLVT